MNHFQQFHRLHDCEVDQEVRQRLGRVRNVVMKSGEIT